eukprot:5867963-Pyramimonas_sp.AAC.1
MLTSTVPRRKLVSIKRGMQARGRMLLLMLDSAETLDVFKSDSTRHALEWFDIPQCFASSGAICYFAITDHTGHSSQMQQRARIAPG